VLEERTLQLKVDLIEFLSISSAQAIGFLQHYGMPTEVLDFTSEPLVAAYFASGADIGSVGLVAAVPDSDPLHELAEFEDLTHHPMALRPRVQRAFTFYSEELDDLKSDLSVEKLMVQWFSFVMTSGDTKYRNANALLRQEANFTTSQIDILDAHIDPFAGVIQLLLDSYPKVDDWSATWLANSVAAAPFIMQFDGVSSNGDVFGELVSLAQANGNYNELEERANNARIWSNRYQDKRGSLSL
jgi:hypothetical protein